MKINLVVYDSAGESNKKVGGLQLNKNKQLQLAISIAVKAHEGQFDRGGKPYILHPLHLMNQLLFDTELATIAVLHDVIEDSEVTIRDLMDYGFSHRVYVAVSLLTHREGDDYLVNYIGNIAANYDALRVKRKDLEHNSCITRLKGVKQKDLDRIAKYHAAFKILGEAKKNFLTP